MPQYQIERMYSIAMIKAMLAYAWSVSNNQESIEFANALKTWVSEFSDQFKHDWYRDNSEKLKLEEYKGP